MSRVVTRGCDMGFKGGVVPVVVLRWPLLLPWKYGRKIIRVHYYNIQISQQEVNECMIYGWGGVEVV